MRLALAFLGLLLLPAGASAHSTITIQGPDIIYTSEDAISNNNLIVDETATTIRFRDREADNGLSSSQCTPGDQEGAVAYEMTCPKNGIQRLNVDLGPNEDRMVANMISVTVGGTGAVGADNLKVNGAVNDLLDGDAGNDVLDTGDGADDVRGGDGSDTLLAGAGNDVLQGGSGVDTFDAGEGDDTVNAPDGAADKITCGGGTDTVRADTVDEVAADCEKVERGFVAPPSGEQTAAEDKTKPQLKAGGSTMQKVSARRRLVRIAASLSEKGEVSASGFLDAGGINTPIKTGSHKIDVAGGGVTILVKLSSSQIKKVMRDLNRRRRVYVRVNVVGADVAGNSVVHPTLKIRLRK